jgi:hypothetical protein
VLRDALPVWRSRRTRHLEGESSSEVVKESRKLRHIGWTGVMRASRRALLRDAACGGSSGQVALLSMRYLIDGIKKIPHPEEAALRDAA